MVIGYTYRGDNSTLLSDFTDLLLGFICFFPVKSSDIVTKFGDELREKVEIDFCSVIISL